MLWLPVWINVTLAPNKLWVLLSFFFHCFFLPLLGHQLWYREIVTKILLQWWKLTVSVLLVKCNFDPQANKANLLFVFMRFEILVVSLTLVTLSLSWINFYFLLILFPAFFFHFLFSHSPLISSPVFSLPVLNSGYPLAPERTVMFPICLHLAETEWIRASPKQEQEKSSHSRWHDLLIFHSP